MELKKLIQGVQTFFQKYKFVALILILGIVLMLLPNAKDERKESEAVEYKVKETINISAELECILSEMKGVGDVKVLITTGEGEETVYQTDMDSTNGEDDSGMRTNTVTVTDSERSQFGLIKQVNPPTYLGAVVICQGADDPEVRLAVIDAVSKATGLGASSISVLKMK